MNRHDYLFINPSGRLYAYGQAREQLMDGKYAYIYSKEDAESAEQAQIEWDNHLQELFLERHGDSVIPAILRRQDGESAGYVQVGWSSWRISDEVRFRVAVEVPVSSVERTVTPYEVFDNQEYWPEGLREQLTQVKELAHQCGIKVGLIGAAGMEALTGMPYLRDPSDVDLIIQKEKGGCLQIFYEELCRIPGRRLDMEFQIPGWGGVKLSEWVSDSQTVLVKGAQSVVLEEKEALLPYINNAAIKTPGE